MTIHKRILPLTAAALLLLGTFGCTPKGGNIFYFFSFGTI